MYKFSIITPTFNRKKYLEIIYDSLCRMDSDMDFEWIIVDDGSTDNTKEVVLTFKKIFEIKYLYQENAGKPTAMNAGMQMADSYISVSLDSDDVLCPDVLKNVWSYFDINTGKFEHNCVCVAGLCIYDNGDIIGKKFSHDYYVSDEIRYIRNKNIKGDKYEFVLTDILKKYPYPVFDNEKNIGPGVIRVRIGYNHQTLYVNKVFAEKQFLPGGLSTQNYLFMYPKGTELAYNEASIPPFRLKLQIKYAGLYIFFARMNCSKNIYLHAKNKNILVFVLGLFYSYIYALKIFLKKNSILQKINRFKKSIFARIFKKVDNTKVFKQE